MLRRELVKGNAKKDPKTQFRQLEWLILAMSGAALGSLQIIHYTLLNSGGGLTIFQTIMDWVFGMSVITLLVHFSFREIYKIHDELAIKREQASKAEMRMKHIIDTTQDAIFTIDSEGDFTFASKSAETLTGYGSEQILSMNVRDVLSPEHRSFISKELNKPKDLAGRHLYVDVMQPRGSIIPIELSFIPIKDRNGQQSGFQGIARDITERKEIEKARQEKEYYLEAIARVGQLILEKTDDTPFEEILEVLGRTSGSERAFAILRENGVSQSLPTHKAYEWCAEGVIPQEQYTEPNDFSFDNASGDYSDVSGAELALQGKAHDGSQLKLSPGEWTVANPYGDMAATLALPITVGARFAGIIGLNRGSESKGWNPVNINLLTTAASMVSQAIERQKANVQLKHHFLSLAETMSNALYFVDPYTASHQQRLAAMADIVGEKLGLDKDRLEWLHFGGLLHDIGKIAVPSAILSKPGKLTDEEWVMVRSHAKRGYEVLKNMSLPDFVTDMVLSHHERLDGSGYPNGKRGDSLSLEVRILGVCDVVEAMSSHRPYRPARERAEILAELKGGRGSKYDPHVVELVMAMLKGNEFETCFQEHSEPIII
jgi:PAS domain S-box-containing protein/putative nucleotidyltransferase with HDIG domain